MEELEVTLIMQDGTTEKAKLYYHQRNITKIINTMITGYVIGVIVKDKAPILQENTDTP